MQCQYCDNPIPPDVNTCPSCGAQVDMQQAQQEIFEEQEPEVEMKSQLVALLLCFFLGGLGLHRFYVGKFGSGILMLLTCGLCGIWVLIDFILILCGNFKDAEGNDLESFY